MRHSSRIRRRAVGVFGNHPGLGLENVIVMRYDKSQSMNSDEFGWAATAERSYVGKRSDFADGKLKPRQFSNERGNTNNGDSNSDL